jgi:hypothetical protein
VPIDVDTRSAPRLVRIAFHDEWPAREEQLRVRQQLLAAGHVAPATRVLIDLRPLGTIAPRFEEVGPRITGDASVAQPGVLPTRTAYLVGSAVQFGFVDQLKAYAPLHMKIEAFANEVEALAWLEQEPKP